MEVMVSLTLPQAAYSALAGSVFLGIGLGLVKGLDIINNVSQKVLFADTNQSQVKNDQSWTKRISSNLSTLLKTAAKCVSVITMISLGCLAFTAWLTGTYFILHAAVGPLIA